MNDKGERREHVPANLGRKKSSALEAGDIFVDEYNTDELVRVDSAREVKTDLDTYYLVETNRGGRLFHADAVARVLVFPLKAFYINDDTEPEDD